MRMRSVLQRRPQGRILIDKFAASKLFRAGEDTVTELQKFGGLEAKVRSPGCQPMSSNSRGWVGRGQSHKAAGG